MQVIFYYLTLPLLLLLSSLLLRLAILTFYLPICTLCLFLSVLWYLFICVSVSLISIFRSFSVFRYISYFNSLPVSFYFSLYVLVCISASLFLIHLQQFYSTQWRIQPAIRFIVILTFYFPQWFPPSATKTT